MCCSVACFWPALSLCPRITRPPEHLFKRALARATACASLHIEVLPAAGAASRVTGPASVLSTCTALFRFLFTQKNHTNVSYGVM